jgi:DNA-binding NtrC family response regulator
MELFKIIKDIQKEYCPPVIMMTFNTDYKLATEFIKKGGADFIEKTIAPESLQLKIEKVIQNHKRVIQAYHKQQAAKKNSNHKPKR